VGESAIYHAAGSAASRHGRRLLCRHLLWLLPWLLWQSVAPLSLWLLLLLLRTVPCRLLFLLCSLMLQHA
jgi:hypothetical protein